MRFEEVYHTPSRSGAYRGYYSLWNDVRNSRNKPSRTDVRQWLRSRPEYTLFKRTRKPKEYLHFVAPHPYHTLQADLMDVGAHSGANDGVKFILTSVDAFTGRAMVSPLKSKQGAEVMRALEPMVGNGYLYLHTDKGTEFYNRNVASMLSRKGVVHYSTENENIKAGMVERFNRTLREVLSRLMEHRDSTRYVDVLDEIVDSYNKTPHSRHGWVPADTGDDDDVQRLWIKRFERETPKTLQPKFKVGDHVRMVGPRRVFARGYHERWTREVFVVTKVHSDAVPITYRVKDLMDEEIDGRFYAEELQLIKYDPDATFKIEKVLRTRRRRGRPEIYVKWLGYPDKFNSWIPKP